MREEAFQKTFLDLQNLYDALEQDRCLDILAGYGMGPRTLWLLWTYWTRLCMLEKYGGYFGPPFQGYSGVNQGDPCLPRFSTWWWWTPLSVTG